MEKYVIKKKNKNKKIGKFDFKEEGYVFKPNIKSANLIQISSLSITNLEITNSILKKKLDKSFRKLAAIILSVLNDEDTTCADAAIALNELTKEKNVVVRKYKEYLKKEEQEKYLKRLKVLEGQLKEKLVYLKLEEEKVLSENLEHGHSR